MNQELFSAVDHYIIDHFAQEDHTLKNVEQTLFDANASMPQGSISASQGKLLQVFAHMCNAKRILELGTLGGYSTIWMARALPEHGKVITIEYDTNHAAVAQSNIDKAGVGHKVELHTGKCMDILNTLLASDAVPFDMVFIDADKPPYKEYFEAVLQLSRPGTIIIADNVVRNGKILDAHNIEPAVLGVKRFNKMLSENKQVTATILQTVGIKEWDGMAIAVVK